MFCRKIVFWGFILGVFVWFMAFLGSPSELFLDRDGNALPRGLLLLHLSEMRDIGSDAAWSSFFQERFPIWFAVISWIIASFGLGGGILYAVLHWLKFRLLKLEYGIISTALGWSLLSTITFLLGCFSWLSVPCFIVVYAALFLPILLVCIVFYMRQKNNTEGLNRASVENIQYNIRRLNHLLQFNVSWWWLACAIPFVCILLLAAPLPPFEFDVCEYHLQVPKEWFQMGKITYLDHNIYGNMPLGSEIPSLAFAVFFNDPFLGTEAGKTLGVCFVLLSAFGMLAALQRFVSLRAGILSAIFYLSTPWIIQNCTQGQNDTALAGYTFFTAWMIWLLYYYTHKQFRHYSFNSLQVKNVDDNVVKKQNIDTDRYHLNVLPMVFYASLAVFFASSAAACKYTAVPFVLLPVIIYIFVLFVRVRKLFSSMNSVKMIMLSTLMYMIIFCVGGGSWYFKNWIFTGNPVYPLAHSIFPVPDLSQEALVHWRQAHQSCDFSLTSIFTNFVSNTLTSFWNSPLILPFALVTLFATFYVVFLSRSKNNANILIQNREKKTCLQKCDVANQEACRDDTNESFSLALPLVFHCLVWIMGIFLLWWGATHRLERFTLLMVPFSAILAGVGFDRLASYSRGTRQVARVVLFLGLGWNLSVAMLVATDTQYFTSIASENVIKNPLWGGPLSHIRINTDDSIQKILLVGDAIPYNIRKPVLYHTCFNACPLERMVSDQPEETRQYLVDEGITHVLVNWQEIARYRSPGNYGFTNFIQIPLFERLCEEKILEYMPDVSEDGVALFRVLPSPTSH